MSPCLWVDCTKGGQSCCGEGSQQRCADLCREGADSKARKDLYVPGLLDPDAVREFAQKGVGHPARTGKGLQTILDTAATFDLIGGISLASGERTGTCFDPETACVTAAPRTPW